MKLTLDPGDYQCYTSLPSNDGGAVRVPGVLSLTGSRPPVLQLHGDVPLDTTGEGVVHLPQVTTLNHLEVDLVQGLEVLLIDCTVHKPFPQRAQVDAAAAVIGHPGSSSAENVFAGLRIQISGLDAILGLSPLEKIKSPRQWEPDVPLEWGAVERLEARRMRTSDSGAEVGARWHASFSAPSGYQHHVRFSAMAEVTVTDPVSLAGLKDDWITPLHGIVALATSRTESITWLRVQPASSSDQRGQQVFGSGISQQPQAADDAELRRIQAAFRCYNGGPTLLDLCRAWQRASNEHHPLIETFGAFLQVEWQHPRPQLLLLLQALEGLHDHEYRETIQARTDEYQMLRSQTREALKEWEAPDSKLRKFARSSIPPRPPTNLAASLLELVDSLPTESLAGQFSDLELVRQVISDHELHAEDWSSALRVVRNSLSHGVRGWDASVLRPAAKLLDRCCRAHLMKLLGVPTDLIADYLKRS